MDREKEGLCPFSFITYYIIAVEAEKRKSKQNSNFKIMINDDDWIKLAEELQKLKSQLPYHINIIDELHADENAHTRILIKLLKYKEEDKYPILNSFLAMLSNHCPEIPVFIKAPEIKFGREYIDGTIKGFDLYGKKFGIIIENKIHWAKDQNRQIERYIESFKENIPVNNIYAVYLTLNGYKIVDSSSLTEKAKSDLGVTNDENGRFIPINYRDDILPYLKETILPNCKIKEEYLLSAIQQYIDHLEGLLGLRKIDKETNSIMETSLIEKLGLKESDSVAHKYSELSKAEASLEKIKGQLHNIKEKLIYANIYEPFENITKAYFLNLYDNSRKIILRNEIEKGGFFYIHYEEWGWEIHFEWHPLHIENLMTGTKYQFNLHTEGKRKGIKKDLIENDDFIHIVKQINGNIGANEVVAFQKTYFTEHSFVCMTYEEQKSFLEKVYKEVSPMIPIIDHLLQTANKKLENS